MQAQLAGAQLVEPDLAVRHRGAAGQRRRATTARLQASERELDVFAGTQVVGCVVPAGALIASWRQTTDGCGRRPEDDAN